MLCTVELALNGHWFGRPLESYSHFLEVILYHFNVFTASTVECGQRACFSYVSSHILWPLCSFYQHQRLFNWCLGSLTRAGSCTLQDAWSRHYCVDLCL